MSYDTKKKIHKLFTLMINFENYWNGIKTTMASKSFDNEKAFKNLDIDKNGTITNKDLENFCSKNDVNSYTNLERKFFFFLFDPNGIETISLETFKKEISPIEKMDKILQKVSVMDDLNDLLKEMIKICRQIETFKKRISQYSIYTKDIFLKIDENCGGSITKKELNRGLDKMGIDLNDEECALIIRQYSQDDDLEIIK